MLCASVSFASNGPETTKDCVINTDDAMEAFVAVDKQVTVVADFNEFDILFDEAEEAFNIEYKERLKQRAEKFRKAFDVEYRNELNKFAPSKEVTNLIRELTKS